MVPADCSKNGVTGRYHTCIIKYATCYDPGPVACILDGLRRIFGYHFPHAYAQTHYVTIGSGIRSTSRIIALTDVDLTPALS